MSAYLVIQATGSQSQWVIKHLLNARLEVHALVRNMQKVPALLQDPRVKLFQGESSDYEAVFRAAQRCKGVFLNTFPIPGVEVEQAKAVVAACEAAGLESIVVSTAMSSNDKALWEDSKADASQLRGYFTSKAAVEDVVRRSNFKSYTILRPGVIHHDYMVPHAYQNFPELPTHGELAHCTNDGVVLPHTDAHDVGKYAVAALQDPTTFAGQEIDLCNEALTIEETRDALVKVSGRNVRVRKRSPAEEEEIIKTIFGQRFHLVANVKDFRPAAVAAKEIQKKFGIPLTSLEETLVRDRAHLLESLPA